MQIVVTAIFAYYLVKVAKVPLTMIVPFTHGYELNLGWLAIPVLFFAVIGTVNGTNFTDGLDGLASSVTVQMCIRDRKKKLFVARDIFGIKPLYYAQMNGTLMFASEIKAFMEHPKFDKVFNEDALGNYLSFQFVPTNETFFKGVFCLQPGHYFTYENGELNITRYFEPNFTGDTEKSFEEIVDDVEAVSYTHLDVYKRQKERCFLWAEK